MADTDTGIYDLGDFVYLRDYSDEQLRCYYAFQEERDQSVERMVNLDLPVCLAAWDEILALPEAKKKEFVRRLFYEPQWSEKQVEASNQLAEMAPQREQFQAIIEALRRPHASSESCRELIKSHLAKEHHKRLEWAHSRAKRVLELRAAQRA